VRGAAVALAPLWLAAALAAELGAKLGSIRFPNSGAPAAQQAFERGVLLLHSFEYDDAREAFVEAERIDPAFALAYWGEALTHNHPLWREHDLEAARAALAKLAPTAAERRAKAPTERERGWLAAVEVLFGEGDKLERDRAYAAALERLARDFPDDLEARAFLALAILGTAQGQRDFAVYMRAAAVAEEVFAANPRHPGALHYLIHSYDDPLHAPLGLRAARLYAEVAPAASHAQHMISHIHVALGAWEDSVEANVRAFEVSARRAAAKGLGVDALNYHALLWLEYSYLQLGRFAEAREKLQDMTGYAGESRSPRALSHHALMRAAWIVESGGRPAPEPIEQDGAPVGGAAADLFASGYAAWLAGRPAEAAAFAERIGAVRETAARGAHCEQRSATDTAQSDLTVAEVLQKSLRALVELDAGHTDLALVLLDEATAAEAAMPLDYGPPPIVKPSHELYGELLLRLGRPADAALQFRQSLARAPRRSLSLSGLARAAHETGDAGALAEACRDLLRIYAAADENVAAPPACGAGPARETAPVAAR
jgi:tetratricopeptide (TPR) repeat protein